MSTPAGLGPWMGGAESVSTAGWEQVFEDRYPSLVRLAAMLVGDAAAGEDIAQDAFAQLVDAGARVREPAAYLHAVVIKRSRSYVRRAIVARRHARAPRPRPPGHSEADDLVRRSVVREALMRLPRRQREAVVLRYFAGLPELEVAESMGVSVGSVKTHLHRARTTLRTELEDPE